MFKKKKEEKKTEAVQAAKEPVVASFTHYKVELGRFSLERKESTKFVLVHQSAPVITYAGMTVGPYTGSGQYYYTSPSTDISVDGLGLEEFFKFVDEARKIYEANKALEKGKEGN